MNAIDLAELEKPIAPVRFPNGRELQVWPANGIAKRLLRENATNPSEAVLKRVLEIVVPGMTNDDYESLTDSQQVYIIGLAKQQVELAEQLIEEARKNVLAGMIALVGHTRPSSPTTTLATSAPVLHEPIPVPEAIGTSNAPRTGKPSSPTTRSKKSNASTTSSPTSTT